MNLSSPNMVIADQFLRNADLFPVYAIISLGETKKPAESQKTSNLSGWILSGKWIQVHFCFLIHNGTKKQRTAKQISQAKTLKAHF